MEDRLYSIAKYFEKTLENKRFLIVAAKSGKIKSLELLFDSSAFKHLTGLHKLDKVEIVHLSSNALYHQILNGKTTMDDIKSDNHYLGIKPRLDNFEKIGEILSSPEDMRKSLKGIFGKGIQADYLLTQKTKEAYMHLFLKDKGDITLPVTFFPNENDFYLRQNAAKWTLVGIEEINEKDEIERKRQIAEFKAKIELKTGLSFNDLKKDFDDYANLQHSLPSSNKDDEHNDKS